MESDFSDLSQYALRLSHILVVTLTLEARLTGYHLLHVIFAHNFL